MPFVLVADDKTNYFVASSKFSHLVSRSYLAAARVIMRRSRAQTLRTPLNHLIPLQSEQCKAYRLVDHLYSVFYIHSFVILLWRGLWHIQEQAILPGDQVMSGIVSLGCGLVATLSFYILQFPLNRCVKWVAVCTC